MLVGQLRHRVSLYQAVLSDTADGNAVVWEKLGDLWGSLEPLYASTSEKTRLSLEQNATHRLMARHDAHRMIHTGQRIVYQNRNFLVRHVSILGEDKTFISVLLEEDISFQESIL